MTRNFRLFASSFACMGQIVGQTRKRRQIELATVLPFSFFDPRFSEIYVVNTKAKLELLTQKNRRKRRFSNKFGPSDRIRTCGIVLPKHARYQLRYTRLFSFFRASACIPKPPALPTAPHPEMNMKFCAEVANMWCEPLFRGFCESSKTAFSLEHQGFQRLPKNRADRRL